MLLLLISSVGYAAASQLFQLLLLLLPSPFLHITVILLGVFPIGFGRSRKGTNIRKKSEISGYPCQTSKWNCPRAGILVCLSISSAVASFIFFCLNPCYY